MNSKKNGKRPLDDADEILKKFESLNIKSASKRLKFTKSESINASNPLKRKFNDEESEKRAINVLSSKFAYCPRESEDVLKSANVKIDNNWKNVSKITFLNWKKNFDVVYDKWLEKHGHQKEEKKNNVEKDSKRKWSFFNDSKDKTKKM